MVGRFLEVVSAIGPFVAGASGMPVRRFLAASAAGTGLWSALYVGLGYVFADSAGAMLDLMGQASLWALGAAAAVAVGAYGLRRRRSPTSPRPAPVI